MPSRWALLGRTGTPTTGSGVRAATIPGRCAAPPAPATITCMQHGALGSLQMLAPGDPAPRQFLCTVLPCNQRTGTSEHLTAH